LRNQHSLLGTEEQKRTAKGPRRNSINLDAEFWDLQPPRLIITGQYEGSIFKHACKTTSVGAVSTNYETGI
jgi:hypothetical protein